MTSGARAAAAMLVVAVAAAVAAPVLAPYAPSVVDPAAVLVPPGPEHLLGTDDRGRDVLSRLLWGARATLGVAAAATALGLAGGLVIGLAAAVRGGWVDAVLTRCVDTLFAVPELLVALGVLAAVGRGPLAVALAIGLASVPGYARLLRGSALVAVRADYVLASRGLGAGAGWVARRHVLPAVRGVAIVAGTAGFGLAVLLAGGLGFLGLGAPPPAPEWGAMLAAGVPDLRDAWWVAAAPGAAIAAVVGSVSVLGDAPEGSRSPAPRRVRPFLRRLTGR